MILPPSIIEKRILVDVPDDYGCYMYRFIDTIPLLKPWYLGIKKDRLPEHGGEIYWSTSKNEEFILLVQGDEPRFILEILEFKPRIDYGYLQIKENRMLLEVPNIKTNPSTYNLSYGIPPLGKNKLPTKEYMEWFREQRKKGTWDKDEPEMVSNLIKLPAIQIRDSDDKNFENDISAKVKEVGGNTSLMNSVLLFEGVGEKFKDEHGKFFPKGSDIVGGTTHGLKGAHQAKARKMKVCRVPYELLKDKSKYFIEALAGTDNFSEVIEYKRTWEDGKKLLKKLYAQESIEPMSEIAKEQVEITYGLLPREIKKAQAQALTDIEAGKNPNSKWRTYTKKELKDMVVVRTTDKKLAVFMSSGKFNEKIIWKKFQDDELGYFINKGKSNQQWIKPFTKPRKEIDVIIHHPKDIVVKETWDENYSDHVQSLKWLLPEYKINFIVLDHEQPDTVSNNEEKTNDLKEQLELNEPI